MATMDGHYIDRGALICPVSADTRHLGHHEFECVCGVHKVSDKSATDNPGGKPFIRRSWTHAELRRTERLCASALCGSASSRGSAFPTGLGGASKAIPAGRWIQRPAIAERTTIWTDGWLLTSSRTR